MTEQYINLPTVCCVLLWVQDGFLLIRRNSADDPKRGMLALPGGFQEGKLKENMWDTAVREVFEETGIVISPNILSVEHADTDEYGHNVVFFKGYLSGKADDYISKFVPNEEVSELVHIEFPVETAYPLHTEFVKNVYHEHWQSVFL